MNPGSTVILKQKQEQIEDGAHDRCRTGSTKATPTAMCHPNKDDRSCSSSASSWKESPLEDYVPPDYMAILEGTLLANGDLKGCWRSKLGDAVWSEFRMILMDRGVYDGGFNISKANTDPTKSSVEEIHDMWDSVDWRITTSTSSNIWGRGRNARFGACAILGSHNPTRRRVILYKVDEAGLRNAQRYAGTRPARSQAVATSKPPDVARKPASPWRERVPSKRHRSQVAADEITAAAATLLRAASGSLGDTRTSGEGSRIGNTGPGGGGLKPSVRMGQQRTGTLVQALPGFSGFKDGNKEPEYTRLQRRQEDLSDLIARAARMKSEKLEIRERALALRTSLHKAKADCEGRVQKAKMDEAALLRAVQELRVKIMEDEKELRAVCDHIKGADEAERHSLERWNERWATEVEPFISRCEQEVKKKVREVEEKTREAQQKRHELESELERLRGVKLIGAYDGVDSSA